MSRDRTGVNYGLLHDLGQQLANLRGEFSKGTDAIGPLIHTISDSDLRGKLNDFATNWSDKKASIDQELNQAAGFAKEAADHYRAFDEGTAHALDAAAAGKR